MPSRSDELHRLLALVRRRANVAVVGPMWSGRTELLHRARQALEGGGTAVLHIRGDLGVPDLEPIRAALPPAVRRRPGPGQPPAVGRDFSDLAELVTLHVQEDGRVLLIDDADLLDDASRSLIGMVHHRLGCPVVATTQRPGAGGASPLALASLVRPLVQITLTGLGVEPLHTLLEERLGGPVSPGATARLHRDSAGLPGLALALSDAAVVAGALRVVDGQWAARDDLWSGATDGVYESFVAGRHGTARDGLELLALAGTVTPEAATALLGGVLLEELEAAGLVSVVHLGGQAVVALDPPGLGDYVERHVAGVRRHRLLSEAARRLAAGDDGLGDAATRRLAAHLARRAAPAPPAGPDEDPGPGPRTPLVGRMVTEARRARLSRTLAAWELSRNVPDAARVLAARMADARDARTVERVLRETDLTTGTDTYAYVELCYLRSRWLLSRGHGLDEAIASMTAGPVGAEALRYGESLSTLGLALRLEFAGADPAALPVLAERAAGAGHDAATARLVLAAQHVLGGRPADALPLLEADRDDRPALLAGTAHLVEGLAHYARGDLEDLQRSGDALAQRAAAEADPTGLVVGSYLAGLSLAAYTRIEQAKERLFSVLSTGAAAGPIPFSPDGAVRTLLACLTAYTNTSTVTTGLVHQARRSGPVSRALPFGTPEWQEAFELSAHDAQPEAGQLLRALGDGLRAAGYVLPADVAGIVEMALAYDPARAEQVRPAAERLGGAVYLTYLDARRAVLDQDAPWLLKTGREFERIGARELAARSYVLASGLFRAAGEGVAATEARSAADALTRHEADLAGDDGEPRFTRREQEIIRMVADDGSNASIAGALHLSPRTVETHIRNIKLKSGAADRRDIARLAVGLDDA